MKKKLIKNLKELIIMLIIYSIITFILSSIFKKTGFTNMFFVFVITSVIAKLIYTIYDCSKKIMVKIKCIIRAPLMDK